jgi:hypothetical protein
LVVLKVRIPELARAVPVRCALSLRDVGNGLFHCDSANGGAAKISERRESAF